MGVDFLCDVHGDEALPYAFASGIEGVPSFLANGERLKKLQESFQAAFVRSSSGWFQTEHGYGTMKPNSANLAFCKSASPTSTTDYKSVSHCCGVRKATPFCINTERLHCLFIGSPFSCVFDSLTVFSFSCCYVLW